MKLHFIAVTALTLTAAVAADQPAHPGYKDTPMIPGTQWHVHDADRPEAPVVAVTDFTTTKPPADAVVLFDGTDLSKWRDGAGGASGWKVVEGCMEVPPKKTPGGGDIFTRQEFGDCQLHLEWRTPPTVVGDSQGRGNSGVFFMGRYEIQVLDSFKNPTYADGAAGSVYGQMPPLVNVCRPPGEWQSYDMIFTAPRFKDGQLVTPAYVTVIQNGVVVQNHTEILGPGSHKALPRYSPHPDKGPLKLQDHGNPMRFRNVWIRELVPAK